MHYILDDQQNVIQLKSAHEGNCIAYLREENGQVILCVMEGAAFHLYDVSIEGVLRLGEEAAKLSRRRFTSVVKPY